MLSLGLWGCTILKRLNCEIYGDLLNHSKGMIVDDRFGTLFTGNIDGSHGLTSGFEVGIKLDSQDDNFISLKRFISWQIETAPYEFKPHPTYNEIKNYYLHNYNEKNIEIFGTAKNDITLVAKQTHDYYMMLKVVKSSPIFILGYNGKNEAQEMTIKIKNEYFRLYKKDDKKYDFKLIDKRQEGDQSSKKETFMLFRSLQIMSSS